MQGTLQTVKKEVPFGVSMTTFAPTTTRTTRRAVTVICYQFLIHKCTAKRKIKFQPRILIP